MCVYSCSCAGLICNNCIALECTGDSACIGVDDIEIRDACANQGASIICGGDVACYRTEIIGECIKGIICNGDNRSDYIFIVICKYIT